MTDNDSVLRAIVFAGPNGSGKSSLIQVFKETGIETHAGTKITKPDIFINPDEIANEIKANRQGLTQDQADREAAKEAVNRRQSIMEDRLPFAYETVFSHPSRVNDLLALKESGYDVSVTFITTDNPDTNVARVKRRVEKQETTGHDVPEVKVRERYERTLSLLPKIAEVADQLLVYDNSVENQKPSLQASLDVRANKEAPLSVIENPKPWVTERLVIPLQERENHREAFEKSMQKHSADFVEANSLKGNHSGAIMYADKHFVAQWDKDLKKAVLHDRLMLDTASANQLQYKPKDLLHVEYSRENIKVKIEQKEQATDKTSTAQPTKAAASKGHER